MTITAYLLEPEGERALELPQHVDVIPEAVAPDWTRMVREMQANGYGELREDHTVVNWCVILRDETSALYTRAPA